MYPQCFLLVHFGGYETKQVTTPMFDLRRKSYKQKKANHFQPLLPTSARSCVDSSRVAMVSDTALPQRIRFATANPLCQRMSKFSNSNSEPDSGSGPCSSSGADSQKKCRREDSQLNSRLLGPRQLFVCVGPLRSHCAARVCSLTFFFRCVLSANHADD